MVALPARLCQRADVLRKFYLSLSNPSAGPLRPTGDQDRGLSRPVMDKVLLVSTQLTRRDPPLRNARRRLESAGTALVRPRTNFFLSPPDLSAGL